MSTSMTDQECSDLLPDYLTNNLDGDVRRQVNEHLQQSAAAREQLAELQAVLKQTQLWHERQPDPPGLQAFMEYAQTYPLSESIPKESWLKRHLHFGSAGLWRSVTTVLVCIIGVQVMLDENDYTLNPSTVRSVPGARASEVTLTVAFKSTSTEQEIRDALVASGARIVDGPDGLLGTYKLAIPAPAADDAILTLRASGIFESAQFDATVPPARSARP